MDVYFFGETSSLQYEHIITHKVKKLRESGINAYFIAFIVRSHYIQNKRQYEEVSERGFVTLRVVCCSKFVKIAHLISLVKKLFRRKTIIYSTTTFLRSTLLFKKIPFFRNRAVLVLELEGDAQAELDYVKNFATEDFDDRQAMIASYSSTLGQAFEAVKLADGLVLMTSEHIALWEERMRKKIPAVALPAVFDPEYYFFNELHRETIRKQYCINEKIVFVYVGGAKVPWQNYSINCRLIRFLKSQNIPVHFLSLVHNYDISHAERVCKSEGIFDETSILNVSFSEISKYLSAADFGLFIRDDHLMNKIVTSAKIGEYIAAGLPVIGRYVNPFYKVFLQKFDTLLSVDEDYQFSAELIVEIKRVHKFSSDLRFRRNYANAAKEFYNGNNAPAQEFVEMVKALMK